jgi:NAD(P)-dependent dehydrogenase (short-subunit alcohol dehydrogenase family)
MTVDNKVIVFIGGYGFLARGIVKELLKSDTKIYVLGRKEKKFAEAYNDEITKELKVYFIQCDANNTDQIKESFRKIMDREQKIDVLINGAFGVRGGNPIGINDKDWSYSIDSSLNSIYKAIREVVPYFYSSQKGKIINISSMYGIVAPDFNVYDKSPNFINPPHYGVAKAGVIQMTKYFASYLGKSNITVNTVSPGPFPSEEVQKDKNFIGKLKNKTCLNKIGQPSDLAGIFILLCSDYSDFITGQNFIIDGGWTIK